MPKNRLIFLLCPFMDPILHLWPEARANRRTRSVVEDNYDEGRKTWRRLSIHYRKRISERENTLK